MRDVIQVERSGGTGDASASVAELGRVADELLPPLVARLGVSDLGEIEVRQGTWRVRIRRAPSDAHAHASAPAATTGPVVMAATGAPGAAGHAAPTQAPTDHQVATSTAVGYF